MFTNILTGDCMSDHRTLLVYKISDIYLLQLTILGLKLKNKNNKNWRNGLFAISIPCQWSNCNQILGIDFSYDAVVSKVDYH